MCLQTDAQARDMTHHGAAIVSKILRDASLRSLWESELTTMRDHMSRSRSMLADRLEALGVGSQFNHIRSQQGMFSYLGLSVEQVQRLREEFSIYMVNSSRVNIAGVCPDNVEYLAESIATVARV